MSEYILWAVLAPGEPAWLEHRTRAILGLDDEEDSAIKLPFKIVPGSSRYHAIVSVDPIYIGAEMELAEELSRECAEPVYSIEQASPPPEVCEYRNGVEKMLEVEPLELTRSLGCPFPRDEEVPGEEVPRPLKTVALLEGVLAQKALRVMEEEAGRPLSPGRFHLEDTPRGLMMTDGTGGLGFAHITLANRLPHVTVYSVTASPSLHIFIVSIMRGEECLGQFAQPPRESSVYPPVGEVKGERTPERILAVLGIPVEWFR